jgi:hypothetical protein
MKLTMPLGILFALLLSGCTEPPDTPWCRPLNAKLETKDVPGIGKVTLERANPACMKAIAEPVCGYCVWAISDREQYVGEAKKTWLDGEPWSKIKSTSILITPKSYAKVKEFVINICKKSNECNQVAKWRLKLDRLGD